MTHHPEFVLFQANLAAVLKLFHPLAAVRGICHVNNQPHEIIPIEDTALAPMAFEFLCFVAGGSEVVYDFQDRFCKSFGGHIPPVIELKREQHLESPPPAAHR